MIQQLSTSTESNGLPLSWVEKIFKVLAAYHGTRFTALFEGIDRQEAKAFWAQELADFTPEEIKRGLDDAKRCKFPPTLAEFIVLCRPALDYEGLFQQASRGMYARKMEAEFNWTHPAVYFAAKEMAFEVLNNTYKASADRWRVELDKAMREYRINPQPVPSVEKRLPSPPPNPEVVEAAMSKIKALAEKWKV